MTTSSSTPNGGTNTQLAARPPPVLWAQRADKLFLTIDIEDCKNPQIKLETDRLHFKGKSDSIQRDSDHSEHEVTIEFYMPVKTEDSKQLVGARGIEFVILKEEEKWWPRLLKDSTKQHWLKVDFPKWKDEDDSEDELGGAGGAGGMGFGDGQPDFSQLMQQFGGGGMGGMGGGMGGLGDEGEDDLESDDDDDDTKEQIPDLEGTS